MPKMKLPKVGERVTVEGHKGVFFVLGVDLEPRTVSLLPSSDGRILKIISADTLKLLPAQRPRPTWICKPATQASSQSLT
jgi:hypothetical protein